MDTKGTKTFFAVLLRIVILCVLGVLCGDVKVGLAQGGFAMPDPKEMAGIPRPVDDLPNGAISVRLIRGQLSNNITNGELQKRVEIEGLYAAGGAASASAGLL